MIELYRQSVTLSTQPLIGISNIYGIANLMGSVDC